MTYRRNVAGFLMAWVVFGGGTWAMPDGPGCDPSGSAACGVFVQASHPYRGGAQ